MQYCKVYFLEVLYKCFISYRILNQEKMAKIINDFKIKEIRIDSGFFPESFYVFNIQLASPFWGEVFDGSKKGGKYIAWRSDAVEKRLVKIKRILHDLKKQYIDNDVNVKIIVFPEYCIEQSMLSYLEEYSRANKLMIIAGDYDLDARLNYAHIIYSDGEKIFSNKQYKLSSSRFDDEYLVPLNNGQKIINRFVWGINDEKITKNMLTVYVCHDFLEYYCMTANADFAGLYIVIMCTPRIEEFYGLSYVVVRSIKGYKSNVVVLSNAVSIIGHDRQKESGGACGSSQFIGPTNQKVNNLMSHSEGAIMAEINLNSAVSKPTRIRYSEALKRVHMFDIGKDGCLSLTGNGKCDNVILLNPNALLKIQGLQKIYALYCVKNYSRVLDTFKNIPIQSNAVFGVYDVLVKSYEESVGFFEKRLGGYMGDKYSELSDPGLPPRKIYSVTEVIKYRGKVLCKVDNHNILPLSSFDDLEDDYFEKNKEFIKKKLTGVGIDPKKENELIRNGIMIESKSDSDVFPGEREIGCEEYLVFIDIYPYGDKTKEQVNRDFRKEILPFMMADTKVRTIELCGEVQESEYSNDGSYIVHYVGSMDDVRVVIMNKIHQISFSNDIRCRTLVVPAVAPLSKDLHLHLDEKMIRIPQLKRFALEMIHYLKYVDPVNPFIIKRIDNDVLRGLMKIQIMYKKIIASKGNMGEVLKKVNSFIYGICYGCKDDRDDHSIGIVKDYCAESYLIVVSSIDDLFFRERAKIREVVKKMEREEVEKYLKLKINKDVFLREIIESRKTIMGDMCNAIKKWNEVYVENSADYVTDLNGLVNVIRYRNIFSHKGEKESDSYVFSMELIDAMLEALLFVEKYCF